MADKGAPKKDDVPKFGAVQSAEAVRYLDMPSRTDVRVERSVQGIGKRWKRTLQWVRKDGSPRAGGGFIPKGWGKETIASLWNDGTTVRGKPQLRVLDDRIVLSMGRDGYLMMQRLPQDDLEALSTVLVHLGDLVKKRSSRFAKDFAPPEPIVSDAGLRGIENLSETERRAMKLVFEHLQTSGGAPLEGNAFALENKITRSSLSIGLRILSVAGVIETKGLGRNGTGIRILRPDLVRLILD